MYFKYFKKKFNVNHINYSGSERELDIFRGFRLSATQATNQPTLLFLHLKDKTSKTSKKIPYM